MLNLVMPSPRLALVFLAAVAAVTLTACLSPSERELNDLQFEARTGHDATGDLTWIANNPVQWRMDTRNGEYTAVIGPPCAMIQAPVEVTATEIRVDMNRAAIAAVACDEPRNSMDRWVHTFINEPINYTWDDDMLTMTNDYGSLTFQRTSTS